MSRGRTELSSQVQCWGMMMTRGYPRPECDEQGCSSLDLSQQTFQKVSFLFFFRFKSQNDINWGNFLPQEQTKPIVNGGLYLSNLFNIVIIYITVVTCKIFHLHCCMWDLLVAESRIQFPDQGLNSVPWHWELGVFGDQTSREVLAPINSQCKLLRLLQVVYVNAYITSLLPRNLQVANFQRWEMCIWFQQGTRTYAINVRHE